MAVAPIALLVEAAYGADPDTDLSAAVWTNITDLIRYVPSITIRAGRHGLGATTDPLQIQLVIDNRDGNHTPFLNTGLHWPFTTRKLPVRISAAATANTPVEQATAFVDTYELAWDASTNECVVNVTALGRLGWMAKKKVVLAVAESTIAATNPVASWPLTDGTSATSAASGLVGGAPMTKSGRLKFGTGTNFPGQPHILDLGELRNTPGKLTGVVPAGTSSTSWRFEFTMNWPDMTPPSPVDSAISWSTAGTIKSWRIGYDQGGDRVTLTYVRADGSGTTTLNTTFLDPYDGVPRRYRVTADQNGTGIDVVLSVNDVAKLTTTVASQTLGRINQTVASAGWNFDGSFDGTSMPAVGGFTFWAPYASAVDTTQASSGYEGEMAGDRIARLCDESDVPVVVVAGPTSAMGVQKDGKLIDLLRECEAADGGLLHDNGPNGSLVYIPRSARYNALLDLTVDVDLKQLQPGFRPVFDGRDALSSATVSQPDGSSGSYEKPGASGDESKSYTLNLADSENLTEHAAWRVSAGSVEGMRYPKVGLNFRRSPELMATWLAGDRIGARIDVTNLPQQHPPTAVEQFVEGYEMRLSDHMWSVDLDCVPASAYKVVVLDTSFSTLVSGVNASAVTFTSVVSQAPRWTTTDEPVALAVGGESPIVATAIVDVAASFVAAGAASHADNASVTPALYAGGTAGDLILVLCAIRSSGTGTVDVSGYTRLVGWANFALFGKIHSGSESNPTVTPTGGSAGDTVSGFTFGLRNTINNISNVVLDWVDWLNLSAQNIAYPPLSTQRLWDGCVILYLGWKADDWTSVATIAGATEIAEPFTVTGNDQGLVADYVIQTTAAAIPTGSFVVTGGTSQISRGMVVAIGAGRSTLTVTRATNGTAISHSAGDAIQVADTGNLGL